MHTLLLASKSASRQLLLKQAQIPFTVINQDADESVCDWNLSLDQIVLHIARYKMEHALVPDGKKEGDICFVLTADTLSQDHTGMIHGKPISREDAIIKIKSARHNTKLYTAFCLERKEWKSGCWLTQDRKEGCVGATYIVDVPDHWIDTYLETVPALHCAGAIAIESYGQQFLRFVDGSYSAIIGLPLYEVREALESLSFFTF